MSEDVYIYLIQQHGGRNRDRTCDLRLVRPLLSQLSYSPVASDGDMQELRTTCIKVAGSYQKQSMFTII